jgi:hypothetical protein
MRHSWKVLLLIAAFAGGVHCNAQGCDEIVDAHLSDGGTEQLNACQAYHLTDGGYAIPDGDGGLK